MGPTVQVDIVLVQHLLNFWDSQGIDIVPVLALLGIAESSPLPPWIAADKLHLAHKLVADTSDDPLLACLAGMYLARRDLPMAQLLRHAENLAQGLPAALRFVHRSIGLARVRVQPVENGYALCATTADGGELTPNECQQTMSALAVMCRYALGASFQQGDIVVRLCCAEGYENELSAQLQMPVSYSDHCQINISDSAWLRSNPAHQALLFANTLRELERKERKLNEHLALYSELQDIIQSCLLRRHVSQENVAGQLGISVRNLQRRLKALGTTYQVLLDESRQSLAMKLIRDEAIPLYEIAYMVGYAEPSAFYKAFKRWTGATPGDYRQTWHLEAVDA